MILDEFKDNGYDYLISTAVEINDDPSLTMQGEDISISELISRFSSGTLPDINFGVDSGSDEDFSSSIDSHMTTFEARDLYDREMTVVQKFHAERMKSELEAKERSEYERLKKLYESKNDVDVSPEENVDETSEARQN